MLRPASGWVERLVRTELEVATLSSATEIKVEIHQAPVALLWNINRNRSLFLSSNTDRFKGKIETDLAMASLKGAQKDRATASQAHSFRPGSARGRPGCFDYRIESREAGYAAANADKI